MAYSKKNKEKIDYLLKNPELVRKEYIDNCKTTVKLAEEWGIPKSTVYNITKQLGLVGIKQKDKLTHYNDELFNAKNPIFCYLARYIDEKYHRVCLRMSVQAKDVLKKLREYFQVSNEVAEYNGTGGYTQGYTMYHLYLNNQS